MTDITSPPTPPQDHATIRAALRALSKGARPSDLALPGVLVSRHPHQTQEQVDLCWKHGAPPPLQELIVHYQEGLMTDQEVADLLPLYPGQRMISK